MFANRQIHDSATIHSIIELAWQDAAPFESIEQQFGMSETNVIRLMRRELRPASFCRWRRRVAGRRSKHSRRNAKR